LKYKLWWYDPRTFKLESEEFRNATLAIQEAVKKLRTGFTVRVEKSK
jgi:hypothetical protein